MGLRSINGDLTDLLELVAAARAAEPFLSELSKDGAPNIGQTEGDSSPSRAALSLRGGPEAVNSPTHEINTSPVPLRGRGGGGGSNGAAAQVTAAICYQAAANVIAASPSSSCASLDSFPAGESIARLVAEKQHDIEALESRCDEAATSEERLKSATLLEAAREELRLLREYADGNCA